MFPSHSVEPALLRSSDHRHSVGLCTLPRTTACAAIAGVGTFESSRSKILKPRVYERTVTWQRFRFLKRRLAEPRRFLLENLTEYVVRARRAVERDLLAYTNADGHKKGGKYKRGNKLPDRALRVPHFPHRLQTRHADPARCCNQL